MRSLCLKVRRFTCRDGRQIYFNAWTSDQLRVYDIVEQKVVKVVPLNFLPDNISVGPNGWYIATGITNVAVWKKCCAAPTAFCASAFRVAAWNPATGQVVSLFNGNASYVAGASIGVQVNRNLSMRCYSGDRVLKIKLPKQVP